MNASYELDRIDYSFRSTCAFCTRTLESYKATYLRLNGQDVVSGATCAKKKAISVPDKIPDFARARLLSPRPPVPPSDVTDEPGVDLPKQMRQAPPLHYLKLRCDTLGHIKHLAYAPLQDAWQELRETGRLSDRSSRVLESTIVNAAAKRPEFAFRNLLAVHAADFWIARALELTDESDFLTSMQFEVFKKLTLTSRQVAGCNRWFWNIDKRLPHLPHGLFNHRHVSR